MTERSEIERLLNQTGRTLEGLPEQYSYHELANAYDRCEAMPTHMICHQSDVIELLVGALRDAFADRDGAIKEITHNCNTCKHWRESPEISKGEDGSLIVTYCTQDCNRIQNGFSGWEWKRRRT